jgi:hypothetical protein
MKVTTGQLVLLTSGEYGECQEPVTALTEFDTDEMMEEYAREVPLLSVSGLDLRKFETSAFPAHRIHGRRAIEFTEWLTGKGIISVIDSPVRWNIDDDRMAYASVSLQCDPAEFNKPTR